MRILLFLLTLGLIFSCKKDENGDFEPLFQNTIKAGVTFALQWDTINPNVSLSINWDAQNLYGSGSDSIDIDGDGQYDLLFECSLLNPDSLHLLNGQQPNPHPFFSVKPSNGYLIRLATEVADTAIGSSVTVYWADSIGYESKIKNNDLWSGTTVNLWQENATSGTISFGPWYNLSETKYIGFNRLNKLGWIEVDATNRENITFKSLARQL